MAVAIVVIARAIAAIASKLIVAIVAIATTEKAISISIAAI